MSRQNFFHAGVVLRTHSRKGTLIFGVHGSREVALAIREGRGQEGTPAKFRKQTAGVPQTWFRTETEAKSF